MRENKFNFTAPLLKALAPLENKSRTYFYDTKVPGLELAVTKASVKTFNVYRWSSTERRPIRTPIGRFPDISIEQARKVASEQVLEVLIGNNPAKAKRDRRDRLRLGDAIQLYIEWMQVSERKECSVINYRDCARRFFDDFKNSALDDITTDKTLALRARVRNKDGRFSDLGCENDKARKADRKVTANKVVRFLSQTFNHMIKRGLWDGKNPCDTIKPFPEQPKTRRLEDDELPKFLKACKEMRKEGDRLCVDAILCALFTGVRRRNISAATYDQFNLEGGIWNIPDTKNSLPHKVYLCPFVLSILQERYEERINNFVFPSVGKRGHVEELRKALSRILKRAEIGCNGLTIHGLKHTFVSYAYEACINPIAVSRMGGHKVSGITARYGHASDKVVREGYLRVAEHMLNICKENPHDNVLPFKKVG